MEGTAGLFKSADSRVPTTPLSPRSEGCHASPPSAASLQRSQEKTRKGEVGFTRGRRGQAGPRYALLSETLSPAGVWYHLKVGDGAPGSRIG
jgi:hypothetical protein